MKKIVIFSALMLYGFCSMGQIEIGDTLTVKKSIYLYSKPNNFAFSGNEIYPNELLILLDKSGEKYYKIKSIKDNNEYFIKNNVEFALVDNKIIAEEIRKMKYSNKIIYNTPGYELQKFTEQFYIANSMMITGTGLGIWNSLNENSKAITYISLGMSSIGFILYLESFIHIKKAGILLNENGVGIKIPLD